MINATGNGKASRAPSIEIVENPKRGALRLKTRT